MIVEVERGVNGKKEGGGGGCGLVEGGELEGWRCSSTRGVGEKGDGGSTNMGKGVGGMK